MLQQLASVAGRFGAVVRGGAAALMAAGLLGGVLAGCGQRGPLTLPPGQQLQRPALRPVTSPPPPPALSPTDSPAAPPVSAPPASAPR